MKVLRVFDTRYGNTHKLALAAAEGAEKVGAVFCGTSTMHGANEATLLSMLLPMLHQGMMIAGVPYSEQRLITTSRGGTPYGASSASRPMADQEHNEDELAIAHAVGKRQNLG